jgi:hypothetical protein
LHVAQSAHGSLHGGPGRGTVVYYQHGSTGQIERCAGAAVKALAAVQFGLFARDGFLNGIVRQFEQCLYFRIGHNHATGGNCAHGYFFLAWHTELADHEDIERQMKHAGNLCGYRYAAARQADDRHVLSTHVAPKRLRQASAGISPIDEPADSARPGVDHSRQLRERALL